MKKAFNPTLGPYEMEKVKLHYVHIGQVEISH